MIKPRVHLIGLGAMGSIIASSLLEHTPAQIIPLLRNTNKLNAFQKEAKSVLSIKKTFLDKDILLRHTIKESYCPEKFPKESVIDNLIITTKTYQTKEALKPYLPYITKKTNILFVQNGLGIIELLRNDIFKNVKEKPNIFQGVIAHGAYLESNFTFNFNTYSNLKVARLPWDSNQLVQKNSEVAHDITFNELASLFTGKKLVEDFRVNFMTYQELLLNQLHKFMINITINPVTSIVDCDNGEMGNNCIPIFTSIVEEALSILKVAYKPLMEYENDYKNNQDYPALDVNNILTVKNMVDQAVHFANVIGAKNSCSMRQDTRYLRETEIEYINGYLVKLARDLNLGPEAAKVNQTMCELVNLRLGLNRKRAERGNWPFK